MGRIYGDEQREAECMVCNELIQQLEALYLKEFQKLTSIGFGDGVITRLTQLLLVSRDAAITPLNDELKKKK